MKVLNTETGEQVAVEPLLMKSVLRKPLPLRALRIDFPFEVNRGRVQGEAGDFLVIDEQGNPFVCPAMEFITDFEDTDYMTPSFREFSKGAFSELCMQRGATPLQVGHLLKVIEEVNIITNGRQPVYVASFNESVVAQDVEVLSQMLQDVNVAIVMVPVGMMEIEGVIEPSKGQ
jgi:hypothetical protein